ncbi:MAG TPA: hypothetical protein VG733_11715 [Chthoniobacteraceae bacterium]|nr:hypothetical protein [Chthoniobacteraceae bacterium]
MKNPGYLFLCGALCLSAGCAHFTQTGAPPAAAIRHKPHLRASMTDAEILRELNFDPAKMKTHFVQGKDGYTTDYRTGNKEFVSITRSLVSGVEVMHDYPGGSQSWELGKVIGF